MVWNLGIALIYQNIFSLKFSYFMYFLVNWLINYNWSHIDPNSNLSSPIQTFKTLVRTALAFPSKMHFK